MNAFTFLMFKREKKQNEFDQIVHEFLFQKRKKKSITRLPFIFIFLNYPTSFPLPSASNW